MRVLTNKKLNHLLDTELKYRQMFCEWGDCKNLKYREFDYCAEHYQSYATWYRHTFGVKKKKHTRYEKPGYWFFFWRIAPNFAIEYLERIEGQYKDLFCEHPGCDRPKYFMLKFCDQHAVGSNDELDDPNRPTFQSPCPEGEGTKV